MTKTQNRMTKALLIGFVCFTIGVVTALKSVNILPTSLVKTFLAAGTILMLIPVIYLALNPTK